MNVTDLQKECEKWTVALSELRASQEQNERELVSLETQRRGLLVGAITEKDAKAQISLRDVNQRIESLHGAQRDNAHAIEEITPKVEHIRDELAKARRRDSAQAACDLIDAHLKAGREKRLHDLVQELADVVLEVSAGEQRVASALRTFGKRYSAQIERLNNSSTSLPRLFEMFRGQLPHVFAENYVESQHRGDSRQERSIEDAATGLIRSLRSTLEGDELR